MDDHYIEGLEKYKVPSDVLVEDTDAFSINHFMMRI